MGIYTRCRGAYGDSLSAAYMLQLAHLGLNVYTADYGWAFCVRPRVKGKASCGSNAKPEESLVPYRSTCILMAKVKLLISVVLYDTLSISYVLPVDGYLLALVYSIQNRKYN